MSEMFHGSDGRYYSETELWERYEAGDWEFCMGETETGQEVVQTDRGELLLLTPLRSAFIGGPVLQTASTDEAAGGRYVNHVPPAGHCPDCGERLLYDDCLNCVQRDEMD